MMGDREYHINKTKRFLEHCGINADDQWRLQDLGDYLTCLQKQADDYLYRLTMEYDRMGWSLTATSYSYDKVQTEQDVIITAKHEATLYRAILKLAYRVSRDWNCILNDNVVSFQDYIEQQTKE
jgi:aminopeptidase-like protein